MFVVSPFPTRRRWLAARDGRPTREGAFVGASSGRSSGERLWRSMPNLSPLMALVSSCAGQALPWTCIGWWRMADALDDRTISLEGAQRVLAAALALAEQMMVQVSVAVAGRAGDLKAFARMDGASMLSGETGRRKVYTVAMTGMATQEFGSILKSEMREEPELFHGMIGIEGLIAIAGGVPIRLDGKLIGAVAVWGGTSAQDQEIAEAAAAAITNPAVA